MEDNVNHLTGNYITAITIGTEVYEIRGTMDQAIHFEGVFDDTSKVWTDDRIHTGTLTLDGGKVLVPVVGCMILIKGAKKEFVCTKVITEGSAETDPAWKDRQTQWVLLGNVKQTLGKVKSYTGVDTHVAVTSDLTLGRIGVVTNITGNTTEAGSAISTFTVDDASYNVITDTNYGVNNKASNVTTVAASVVTDVNSKNIEIVSAASITDGAVTPQTISRNIVTAVDFGTFSTTPVLTNVTLSQGTPSTTSVAGPLNITAGTATGLDVITHCGYNSAAVSTGNFATGITYTSKADNSRKYMTNVAYSTEEGGAGKYDTENVVTSLTLNAPTVSKTSVLKAITNTPNVNILTGTHVVTSITDVSTDSGKVITEVTTPTLTSANDTFLKSSSFATTDIEDKFCGVSASYTTDHRLCLTAMSVAVPTSISTTTGDATKITSWNAGGSAGGNIVTAITGGVGAYGEVVTKVDVVLPTFSTESNVVTAVAAPTVASYDRIPVVTNITFPTLAPETANALYKLDTSDFTLQSTAAIIGLASNVITSATGGAIKRDGFAFPIVTAETISVLDGYTQGTLSTHEATNVVNGYQSEKNPEAKISSNVQIVSGIGYTPQVLTAPVITETLVYGIKEKQNINVIASHSTFNAITSIPTTRINIVKGITVDATQRFNPLMSVTTEASEAISAITPATIAVVTKVNTEEIQVVTAVE